MKGPCKHLCVKLTCDYPSSKISLSQFILHTQPFYMKFCNGVDENLLLDFVLNIGYCVTNKLPYKSFHSNQDIFYDKIVLIFMNIVAKQFVK